ncbi:MAG: hypothetical protein JW829_09225 [Pirellulales bacterium]|nr:hypothetical protein [Pirellulales bacterium]
MKISYFSILVLFAGWSVVPQWAQGAAGDVIQEYSSPGNRSCGLAFDGRLLWVSDRNSDSLVGIDPADGREKQRIASPGFQVEELAADGKCLWALDTETNMALKLNLESGITEHMISLPCNNPQGLAFDGKYLWVADNKQRRLFQFSTEDGTTITDIMAPSSEPYGLAFDGKYLWVSDRASDMIYMVWPANGDVVAALESPSKFPRGLAYDGKNLWNVDFQSNKLYGIKAFDGFAPDSKFGRHERLEFVHQFRNSGPGEVQSLEIYVGVPHDSPYQKIRGPIHYDPAPSDFLTDKWGQQVAHFHYDHVPAGELIQISMTVDADLFKTRFFILPEKTGTLADIPKEIKDRYLGDDTKYCMTHPLIAKTVQNVVGDETNCYWIARRLFDHVIGKVDYELAGGWNIAPKVLEQGTGSCSEYSFSMIALCRAAGLPARYVGSVVLRDDDAWTDRDIFHRWAEVYLPNYGWVPMDLARGRTALKDPAVAATQIAYRPDGYLITSIGGGGSEYLQWNYTSMSTWKAKGPCKVETIRFGEWSPLK